jgi:hypothetical protein
MGFRPFRPALDSVAVSDGQAMAGVSAVSASVMPIPRPSAGRPLPGSCNSRNFRKRYANGRWLGVAGAGRRIARARIVAAGNSFAPHRGPEIDVRCGRVWCHRAMALREIIEASEHYADPVQVGLGRHTPQHCSVLSSAPSAGSAQDNSFVPALARARPPPSVSHPFRWPPSGIPSCATAKAPRQPALLDLDHIHGADI